jgi:superfamily I DNA and RNA helicase
MEPRFPKFITTESLGRRGEVGERQVWAAIKRTFSDRECVVYWRYPIFSQFGKTRKEPDILIADLELGLIIVEVKSLRIEQIVSIVGHSWYLQNFYSNTINPYEQAESQLFALLEYSDREPSLQHQVRARVLLALPQVSEREWQQREFNLLPSCPPILFLEHLNSPELLLAEIKKTTHLVVGKNLNREEWKLLLTRLGSAPIFQKPAYKSIPKSQNQLPLTPGTSGYAIAQTNAALITESSTNEPNIRQIPPGYQRIRGIAGSGKTTLLCQKAAYMHLEHPEWDIALVFFTRSLYQTILFQVDYWLSRFSDGEVEYIPNHPKFKVLHAWGAKDRPGFYRKVCDALEISPLSVNYTQHQSPQTALGLACRDILKSKTITPIFDAILIDEAQDLLVDAESKWEDRQPFFALAERALRGIDGTSQDKRLIWADDEMQSLESPKTATASELFGDDRGQLVSGNYATGIPKTIFLHYSYRTPEPILVAAQAIAMGLTRPLGALARMIHPPDWEAIGYRISGNTLERSLSLPPHPILQYWQGELFEFTTHTTRQAELTALSNQIVNAITQEQLQPSQQILVIVLGNYFDATQLQIEAANFLISRQIKVFIPGTTAPNILEPEPQQRNPNKFWHPGAVTISRIHRAKGNQADMVYIIGCDRIAWQESRLSLRHQLFIALTRSRGWVNLSGIGNYYFYTEIQNVIACQGRFTLPDRPCRRYLSTSEVGEIIQRYAAGDRNFGGVDLRGMQLAGIDLRDANAIGANLSGANLKDSQLDRCKLVIADLTEANLAGASLKKAKLMGAMLAKANLAGADLSYADLSDVDLHDVDLSGAKLLGTCLE